MRVHIENDEVTRAEAHILEKGEELAHEILKELHTLKLFEKRRAVREISLSIGEEYILSVYFSRNPKYMGIEDSVSYGFEDSWGSQKLHHLRYLPKEKIIKYGVEDLQRYWEIKVTIGGGEKDA